MLTESGHVRLVAGDGSEWSFTPSFARIATLGAPHEIVRIFAALHGPKAEAEAAYVLACLCDQEDPLPLLGSTENGAECERGGFEPMRVPGLMPPGHQVIIARHLMRHGIVGRAKPGAPGGQQGQYSDKFDAREYVAAARVHLGLSSADAEALSMTEFQDMFEMKFPGAGPKKLDVPSLDEYRAAKARKREREAARV